MSNKMLTLDQVLKHDDRPTKAVPVPEWSEDPDNPQEILLAPMSSGAWDAIQAKFIEGKQAGLNMLNANLLANCWVDEKGKRVVAPGKVPQLAEKSAPVMNRLGEICQQLNGLKKKDVEELVGE